MQKQKKIIDSSPDISTGGRADRYWRGKKIVQHSSKGITSKLPKTISPTKPIDQYKILSLYKLKGFEWGNWLGNNERSDKLIAAAISLRDLSKVMRSQNLGMDGTIGVAFGARGMSGAKAHFEPASFMINLTKNNGDNSLAHEYGHAVDYFFGTYIDQNKHYRSLVGGSSTARKLKDNNGGQIRTLANGIVDSIIMDGKKLSDSYQRLITAKSGDYWRSRNEIWARFFEQYIAYKLNSMNVKNPFLTKSKYESSTYLCKRDFERVLPAMDTFITIISRKMNEKPNSKVYIVNSGKKSASKQ